jgi:hypothetical protein
MQLLVSLLLQASLLLLGPTYTGVLLMLTSAAGVNVADVPAITDVDGGTHNSAGDQNETQQTKGQLLPEG